jgi:Tfp pilus assembly protein PilO
MKAKTFAYEHRWQIGAFLGAGTLAHLLLFVLATLPMGYRAATLRQEVQAEEKKHREIKKTYDAWHALDEKIVFTRSGVEEFYRSVLSTKRERMTLFQKELRRMAGEAGLLLTDIGYQSGAVQEGGVVRFTSVLPLEGTYNSMRRFISLAEANSNMFMAVEAVSLRSAAADRFDQVNLGITISTYFLESEPEAAAGAIQEDEKAP